MVKRVVLGLFLSVLIGSSWMLPVSAADFQQSKSSKKFLFIIGGGGESDKDARYFKKVFGTVIEKAKKAGYQISALYGADAERSKKVGAKFGVSDIQPFDELSFYYFISKIEAMLGQDILPGDQVMVVVDAHGAPQSTAGMAHVVACGEGGNGDCNLNEFRSFFERLKAQNTAAAFVDGSCFSGSSLDLASDNTCVLTMARRDGVSVAATFGEFTDKLETGQNLEETFLRIRKENSIFSAGRYFPTAPQISTEAGLEVNRILSGSLRYVDYVFLQQFRDYDLNHVRSAEGLDTPPIDLWDVMMIPSGPSTGISKSLLLEYMAALKEYKFYFEKYLELYLKVNPDFGSFMLLQDSTGECSMRWRTAALGKNIPKKCIKFIEESRKNNPTFNEYYERMANNLREFDEEIGLSFEEGQTVSFFRRSDSLVRKILKLENKIYLKLYSAFSSGQNQESNPCIKFKF